jgi:FMN reductase [NAD(P)H]
MYDDNLKISFVIYLSKSTIKFNKEKTKMDQTSENANWALKMMQNRQSVRRFTDQPISEALLHEILAAGINAATGGNLQPYSIIVEKDPVRNEKLCELCEGQRFIADAPVNLIFLIDLHKLAIYSRSKDAPFSCHKSFRHFFVGLEDLVCAAQAIETAAWLNGIGSCYVGTILESIPECVELYHLPKLVAPVLILSMGYPRALSKKRKKLDYDMVVFDGDYPALSAETICAAYDKKYEGRTTKLPSDSQRRQEILNTFMRALRTTYNEEKYQQILKDADQSGFISEIQRIFGLHYHAEDMLSGEIIQYLADQNLHPFYSQGN